MTFSQILMLVMAAFFVIGALDRLFGGKLGLGSEYEKGFALMGTISLSIVGLICISPVIAIILKPFIVPVYNAIGADASMFAPTFLSVDAGGYSIAVEMAGNADVGKFSGLVVASMVGSILSFTIPVAVGLIERSDLQYFAIGLMSGLVTSPVGCFFGGLASGLAPSVVLINLLPVMIVALLIAIGLLFFPYKMIKGFKVFSICISSIITMGLCLAAFEKLTGIVILNDMRPIGDGLSIAGSVVIVIAGVMPFIKTLMKILNKPLDFFCRFIGINNVSVIGMFLALASLVPVFVTFKDMNNKGKVIVAAFAGSAANMLGAHLGFISAVSPDMILPMFVSKIAACCLALPFAILMYRIVFQKKEGNVDCLQ